MFTFENIHKNEQNMEKMNPEASLKNWKIVS